MDKWKLFIESAERLAYKTEKYLRKTKSITWAWGLARKQLKLWKILFWTKSVKTKKALTWADVNSKVFPYYDDTALNCGVLRDGSKSEGLSNGRAKLRASVCALESIRFCLLFSATGW